MRPRRPDKQPPVPGAGALGMWIFLASLSMLFAASLTGYLIVRLRAERWLPEGVPGLPSGLWLSTVVIVASSVTIQWALNGIRAGREAILRRGLGLTLALGVLFLALQTTNWLVMIARDRILASGSLYAFTFYVLTGLHALHVLGGLIPLAITTWNARRGRYTWASWQGPRLVVMYWHFLGAVWLVLFAVLGLGS